VEKNRWSRIWSSLLKISLSLIALLLVVKFVDARQTIHIIARADKALFVSSFVLYQLSIVIRAYRWNILLKSYSLNLSLYRATLFFYTGMFFGLVLPTGFGGDVVRAIALGKETKSEISTVSVIVDRLSGLLVLFGLALVVLPFGYNILSRTLLMTTGILCLGGLLAGFVFLEGSLLNYIVKHISRANNPTLRWVQRFNKAVFQLKKRKSELWKVFGVSFVFNLLWIMVHYQLALALDLNLPLILLFTVVPIATILALVPSIQGLGLRESAIVLVLVTSSGVESSQALALSLLVSFMPISAGLIGGVLYLLNWALFESRT